MGEDIEDVIPAVKMLKEEGNYNFKLGEFKIAIQVYTRAIHHLGAIILMGVVSVSEVSELAVLLNLNLAACALKLGLSQEVIQLCSLILSIDQGNVKALFRRALAYINLGNLEFGFKDLVKAKQLNPTDSNIQKELDSIHTSMEELKFTPPKEEGVVVREREGKEGEKEGGKKGEGEATKPHFVDQQQREAQQTTHQGIKCSELEGARVQSGDDRPFTYRNKSNQTKSLVIHPRNMEKLKKGENIMFYDQFSFSVLSIRLLPQNSTRVSVNPGGQDMENRLATNEINILIDTHIDHSMVAEVSTQIPISTQPDCDKYHECVLGQFSSSSIVFDLGSAKMRAARDATRRALQIARANKKRGRHSRKGKTPNQHQQHIPPRKPSIGSKRRSTFSAYPSSAIKKRRLKFSTFTAFPKLAPCDVVQASIMF